MARWLGIAVLALAWSPASACTGWLSPSGECHYRMPMPGENVAMMELEGAAERDPWRRCLEARAVSEECPAFVFHRAQFEATDDPVARQKLSIITWQAGRAAFRCETETFARLNTLISGNFSGVAEADLARTLPALAEMQTHIEETC
ncbi:MAG: hypothetical protein AAGI70_09265 [Pseudomonadota bacterium]